MGSPKSETRTRAIMDDIAHRISAFELRPGQRLTEEELARRYGVSRTPVREALKMLQQLGLVESFPSGGHAVKLIELDSISNLMTIWAALEELVVDLAGKQCSREDLEAFLHMAEEGARDPIVAEQFHYELARLSGNPELVNMLKMIYTRTQAYRRLDGLTRNEEVQHDHIELAKLMLDGQLDQARVLIREHIEKTHRFIELLMAGGVSSIFFEAPSSAKT